MGNKRFGFKYEWLEPSMANDPRYQSDDLFISIAKDVARIAVEELPENFTFSDVLNKEISPERLEKAWASVENQSSREVLLVAAIQFMLDALHQDTFQRNSGWESISTSRSLILKASTKDPGGIFGQFGKLGGKKAAEIQNEFRKKLCITIDHYLVENHLWNDPDAKGTINEIVPKIWDAILEATESGSDWNGYTLHTISHARLGRRTISDCVSRSKRRNV
ncbi:hypothetical protein FE236_00635 [Mariprofundus erugo]|uniref:hypothetical protein n=1 Tax=Mariprofundus erugo TaxID=2528639 RepID=UPI0010FCEBC0|nr:hypothetical protein [Mariprofundus erugo]TLS78300.1 hypothetical protein FE236_00635 [Mariprofundus erugo]